MQILNERKSLRLVKSTDNLEDAKLLMDEKYMYNYCATITKAIITSLKYLEANEYYFE